jgi:hypothetical protein
MRLSIFPKCKALPESKEEKAKQAWYTSKPHNPVEIEVTTDEDLIETVCDNAWSPSIFNGYRLQANFVSTDFMVLDIDNGMTIEEAENMVHKLDIITLCLPSTSHSPEHHKFRLVFPLSRSITKKEVFEATMFKLSECFPADPQCIGDTARFYFGCKMVDGFWYGEGKLLEPVATQKVVKQDLRRFAHKDNVVVGDNIEELITALYGEKRTKVPDNIAYFLEHAPSGLENEMYARGNSFLFTCGLLALDQERVEAVFEKVYPYDITTHVEYMVDKIYNEGYTAREEL